MRAFFILLLSLIATIMIVAVCYQWLDRPLALLLHTEAQRTPDGWWKALSRIPNPLIPLAFVSFIVVGVYALIGRSLQKYQAAALVASLSVLVTEAAKEQLKFLFGRTWPESWIGNNPSFIRDGVYGFHFMHGGGEYNSFPSGHMAAACAILMVAWLWYPRLKWLCVAAGLAVGAGLVGANYHFLSDVIAGVFLGGSIGLLATAIWEGAAPANSSRMNRGLAIKD